MVEDVEWEAWESEISTKPPGLEKTEPAAGCALGVLLGAGMWVGLALVVWGVSRWL